ncbi:hypothetical protein GCM10009864_35040 [Streptomyces lunalinharesii]|uniref:Allene oxide cyclase barrel-like domain-containing protein n=2 Tax=Streptomyces lunalinharesii TaxID=333384 RepID=A0ABN3RY83_9ACTN
MVTSIPRRGGVHGKRQGKSRPRAALTKLLALPLVTAVIGVCTIVRADAETPEGNQAEVLELKVQNEQHATTDLGPTGPSLGDMEVYSGAMMKDGRRVGRGGGACQILYVKDGELTSQCLITIDLEHGSLAMQSLWASGTTSLTMAITGGTGIYKNARGTARYWDIATPNERLRADILH